MRPLLTIKGLTVQEVAYDPDDESIFIQFQQNAYLRAWVKFLVKPETTPLSAFSGKTVEQVSEPKDKLELKFKDGLSLTLDFTVHFGDDYAVEKLLYENHLCDPPVSCVIQSGEIQ